VEFVSPAEVLTAVTELRRIRDVEGALKYVGISGYPVSVLCSLAEFILEETGEPLDCVMSYANFTLQNRRLETEGLDRLQATGVGVVLNASILGMGLLRRDGIPIGGAGDWHPAPDGLRQACRAASDYCHHRGERIETVAIGWALETWLSVGGRVGSRGSLAQGLTEEVGGQKLGVSVMGVSSVEELDETARVWQSVLDRFKQGTAQTEGWGNLATGVWQTLGEWQDFAWASPGEDYVRVRMTTDE
jgi:D-arabinose 1-dehydrogenase